jgi:SAM-dependent methyltransferase
VVCSPWSMVPPPDATILSNDYELRHQASAGSAAKQDGIVRDSSNTMNDERRLQRAGTFDEVAELYDSARREIPHEIIRDLFDLAGIEPVGANVLEIGCGTGQATLPLAQRGCRVVCIEMGANLARIARRNLAEFPLVELVNARFEDWEPAGTVFEIVFAATSWHWLDPRLRYAKAAAVLKPAGVLAFTMGGHAFPPGFDTFFAEIQPYYEAIGWDRLPSPPPNLEATSNLGDEIERSGYFDRISIARHVWIEEFTADEYVAMMGTASDHILMEPEKREWLFDQMRRLIGARPGGRIRKHNLAIPHVARKFAPSR